MKEMIVAALQGIPEWLQVVFLSAIPITEYQLSIPLGIHEYGFAPLEAFVLAALGGTLIFFPVFLGFDWLRHTTERLAPRFLKPLDALLARGERKLKDNYARYGAVALFLFLVIPFPFTGVWTASLAAVALKIPFRAAAIGILTGMLGGAAVVTLASIAGGSVFTFFT